MKKALFFLLSMPALLRAAWRVRRLEPGHDLPELVEALRAVKPWRIAALNRPADIQGFVGRVAGLFPLRGLGPCMRRSLILLDLWSRCGIEPRFHLGVASASDHRSLHAWVTSRHLESDPGHVEIWSG